MPRAAWVGLRAAPDQGPATPVLPLPPKIQNDFLQAEPPSGRDVQLNCSDCHNPHAADYSALLTARDNELVLQVPRGPVGDSEASCATYEDSAHVDTLCIDCHTPHGSTTLRSCGARNPDLCLGCHADDVDGDNRHPFRPTFYDVMAQDGLTCTSTCHEPHGTDYNYMLIGLVLPAWTALCLQCHTRVGIDF